ncbi:uncharacterized protein (TIGR03086 family) [Prauserella isguenensis]|uniref:Uncharacterized protein (TIGR03086 family) n=1 Tax=Prauserella isguenensis TaxID=1470180 RepID=A0A839S4K2_9PSEU|nr:TIGR03086 family metal-binding protein [Prauserella isguenensis]MBB3052284.1 uncharacterized protein (TIGR03086 family) [Prauserella isguenensis]
MTTAPVGPARRHADDAAALTALVDSAAPGDWARPSPVAEWTALDVVTHLVEWSRGFLTGAGVTLPDLDVGADPAAAWRRHTADVQSILDDPRDRRLVNPHIGTKPVAEAVDEFYTADVWMHSWDLAKALGREPDLDPARCAAALEGMRAVEDLLRNSGQFGPAVPVPGDAPAQDRLMAFLGRDPAWRP